MTRHLHPSHLPSSLQVDKRCLYRMVAHLHRLATTGARAWSSTDVLEVPDIDAPQSGARSVTTQFVPEPVIRPPLTPLTSSGRRSLRVVTDEPAIARTLVICRFPSSGRPPAVHRSRLTLSSMAGILRGGGPEPPQEAQGVLLAPLADHPSSYGLDHGQSRPPPHHGRRARCRTGSRRGSHRRPSRSPQCCPASPRDGRSCGGRAAQPGSSPGPL